MKVLFHHIPKTAGSSLIVQLRKFIPPACDNARYDQELSPEKMLSPLFRFYHGHFSFKKVLEFKRLNPSAQVFTFLRNPLNRVISHYYNRVDEKKVMQELSLVEERGADPNIQRKKATYKNEIFGLTLKEYLMSEIPHLKESYTNRHMRFFCKQASYQSNRILALEEAKKNLNSRYTIYGITEMMDLSLNLIENKLQLPKNSLDGKTKVNSNSQVKEKRYSISSLEMSLIVENNMLDIELYHHALSVFQKATGQEIDFFVENDPLQTCLNNGPIVVH